MSLKLEHLTLGPAKERCQRTSAHQALNPGTPPAMLRVTLHRKATAHQNKESWTLNLCAECTAHTLKNGDW